MSRCEFWSCAEEVSMGSALCIDHTTQSKNNELDECLSCEEYKESAFTLCSNCEPLSSQGSLLQFNTIDFFSEQDERDFTD